MFFRYQLILGTIQIILYLRKVTTYVQDRPLDYVPADVFLILSVNEHPNDIPKDRLLSASQQGSVCSESKIPVVMFDYYPNGIKKRGNIMV